MYISSTRRSTGADGNSDLFSFTDGTVRGEHFYFCFINWVDADVSNPHISIDTLTLQLLHSGTPVRRRRANEAVEKHASEKKIPGKTLSLEIHLNGSIPGRRVIKPSKQVNKGSCHSHFFIIRFWCL